MTWLLKSLQSLQVLALAAALFMACALAAGAQDLSGEQSETEALAPDVFEAPVIVDGETLFVVRGSSALPGPERAKRIQTAIVDIATSSQDADVTITFRDSELGTEIFADGKRISVVTEADAELEQTGIAVLSAMPR